MHYQQESSPVTPLFLSFVFSANILLYSLLRKKTVQQAPTAPAKRKLSFQVSCNITWESYKQNKLQFVKANKRQE